MKIWVMSFLLLSIACEVFAEEEKKIFMEIPEAYSIAQKALKQEGHDPAEFVAVDLRIRPAPVSDTRQETIDFYKPWGGPRDAWAIRFCYRKNFTAGMHYASPITVWVFSKTEASVVVAKEEVTEEDKVE